MVATDKNGYVYLSSMTPQLTVVFHDWEGNGDNDWGIRIGFEESTDYTYIWLKGNPEEEDALKIFNFLKTNVDDDILVDYDNY